MTKRPTRQARRDRVFEHKGKNRAFVSVVQLWRLGADDRPTRGRLSCHDARRVAAPIRHRRRGPLAEVTFCRLPKECSKPYRDGQRPPNQPSALPNEGIEGTQSPPNGDGRARIQGTTG